MKGVSKIRIPYTRLEYLLEATSAAGVLLGTVFLLVFWTRLPDLIPQHYDFMGTVDAWGRKEIVMALPITSFVLYLSLTLVRIFASVSKKNDTSLRSLILSMELLTWIKTWTVVTFTYLTWGTIYIALGYIPALSPYLLPLLIAFSLIIVFLYCVLILREQTGK